MQVRADPHLVLLSCGWSWAWDPRKGSSSRSVAGAGSVPLGSPSPCPLRSGLMSRSEGLSPQSVCEVEEVPGSPVTVWPAKPPGHGVPQDSPLPLLSLLSSPSGLWTRSAGLKTQLRPCPVFWAIQGPASQMSLTVHFGPWLSPILTLQRM